MALMANVHAEEAKKPIEWGKRDWQVHRAHWFRNHFGFSQGPQRAAAHELF